MTSPFLKLMSRRSHSRIAAAATHISQEEPAEGSMSFRAAGKARRRLARLQVDHRKACRRLAGLHVEHLGPATTPGTPVHAVASQPRRAAAAAIHAQRHRVVHPDEERAPAEILRRQPARPAARVVPENGCYGATAIGDLFVHPDLVEMAVIADHQVLVARAVRWRERGRRVEHGARLVEQWLERRRPSLAAAAAGGEAEDEHVAASGEAVHHLLLLAAAEFFLVVHHVGDVVPAADSAETRELDVGPSAVPASGVGDAEVAGDRRRRELRRRRVRREDDLRHHHAVLLRERMEGDLVAGERVHEGGIEVAEGDPAMAGADAALRPPRRDQVGGQASDGDPGGQEPCGEAGAFAVVVAEDEERRRGDRGEGGAPGGAGGAGAGVGLEREAAGGEREEIRREVVPPPTRARHARAARAIQLSWKAFETNYIFTEIEISYHPDIDRIITELPIMKYGKLLLNQLSFNVSINLRKKRHFVRKTR